MYGEVVGLIIQDKFGFFNAKQDLCQGKCIEILETLKKNYIAHDLRVIMEFFEVPK